MDKIISDIQKKQNIILIIPEEKYQNTLMMLLEQLEKEKKNICFVSANKTKDALEKELKEKKISTEKIFFVDCVSKSISKGKISWSDEKTQYIDNPTSLTQISLAIFKLMENTKIDFLVLDSINTLLIYNEEKEILKFVHHTTAKLKANNITGIFTSLKEGINEKSLKNFSQFVDKIIESDPPVQKEFVRKKGPLDSFEEIKL
ncbi:MAG: hypothetical protein COT90_00800 [Candidatus Diapherotrites archaeon CG10_big_fil_rev_8_21_14_0_10_31_34]|nr:MAG: hypothetical protein COT90_00800 [Candidatus Diapherotrites archaeon CG10_big_fil_rev_8_21_14_0_10_31_34]